MESKQSIAIIIRELADRLNEKIQEAKKAGLMVRVHQDIFSGSLVSVVIKEEIRY